MQHEKTLVTLIGKLTRHFAELQVETRNATSDLTARQLLYLETVHTLGNPTLSEVAEALALSKPSVTNMVKQLAATGYVRKVRSDADRRVSHLHLTERGERVAQSRDRLHRQIAAWMVEPLSEPEVRTLVGLLAKIVQ